MVTANVRIVWITFNPRAHVPGYRVDLGGASRVSVVFINYRAKEQPLMAKHIYNRLARRLGRAQVFRDHDSLQAGQHYPQAIRNALESAQVLLVVVGPQWLTMTENGTRYIDRDSDWVRREIARAFERGIKIIPVLLGDTPVLTAEQLPPNIRNLAYLQVARILDKSFESDIGELVKEVANTPTPVGRTVGQIATRRRRRPIIITAAIVVPALAVLVVPLFIRQPNQPFPGPPTTSAGSTSQASTPTTNRTSESTNSTTTVANDTVRWHGDIVPQNGGIDLDQVPPKRQSGVDILIDLPTQVDPGERGKIGIWHKAQQPTKAECESLLDGITQGVPAFDPPAGATLCIRTDQGRIAASQYTSPDHNGLYKLDTVIWN